MIPITGVTAGSPAARAGLKAGDLLCDIDGNPIHDVLDYMFYAAEAAVTITYHRGETPCTVHIKKSEYDDLGLEFQSFLMDEKQSCTNKCIFCFIDQMPPGMRDTLYFKDDDARLSFLQGNYVTLTNLSDRDIDRMIAMKLGLNVSVHTTNPELRCRMMHNRFAGEKLRYLKRMSDAGLSLNCQIVLCPEWNDRDELSRTLTDLGALMPNIQSVAVVPVGVTKFREGLAPLRPFTQDEAAETIDRIAAFQQTMLERFDTRMVFPADEFFLLAHRDLPDEAYYEGYPQYENGVGMLRSLIDEFQSALEDCDACPPRTVSIATGVAAYPTIAALAAAAEQKLPGLHCPVYPIQNNFFGTTITVTGLLTGQDLLAQLRDKPLGDLLLLSETMVKRDEPIFLDDMSVAALSEALGTEIRLTPNDGYMLAEAITGVQE